MSAETVPLPTAVGPARTVRRAGGGLVGIKSAGSSAEALAEGRSLVRAEPAHPARLRDPDLGHDRARLHLAHAGKRLEQGNHLELPDDVVLLAVVDHGGERALGVLEPLSLIHIS